MYGQGAGIADIGEVGVELEGVDKRPGFFAAAVDVEGEHGAGIGIAELFLGGLIRRGVQTGVVDLGDLGVAFQVLGDGLGVGIVLFDAQPHRLNSIQRQPGIEGGDSGAGIAQQAGAGLEREGWGAEVGVFESVVGLIRGDEIGEYGLAVAGDGPVEGCLLYTSDAADE